MIVVAPLIVGALFGLIVVCGGWGAVDLLLSTETLTQERAWGVVILSAVLALVATGGIILREELRS